MKMRVSEANKCFAYNKEKNGEVTIYGYKGLEKKVEFPTEIAGAKVTRIGKRRASICKSNFKGIEEAIIPNGIIAIGNDAFKDCTSLKSINIPDSVTSIGYWAFWGCENLKSITIPDTVTNIGRVAFACCDNLMYVRLSNGLEEIVESTFWKCKNLKSITIPKSVKKISRRAFEGSSLKTIKLPYKCKVEEPNAIPYGTNVEYVF